MEPKISLENWEGRNNSAEHYEKFKQDSLYVDRSTICVVPTRGVIPALVVQNWMGMIIPMNQKFTRIFLIGLEVGEAYDQAFNLILNNPELASWKYIFTLEEDNMVPPDILLKLYKAMDEGYDAVGALYWTKGEGGAPMCYGNPREFPINFIPQQPGVDTLTECNGLGMGATMFKVESIKKFREKFTGPLFKTMQVYEPGKGVQMFTQDLYHFAKGRELGFRYACDSRVKVGHLDVNTNIIW